MKKELTESAKHAKDVCKNCALREGIDEGFVIRFSSHPVVFKNRNTGEEVTLKTGYGIYRKDTGFYECDMKNGYPSPFDSYWEALANIRKRIW